jgi:hypothetical protein
MRATGKKTRQLPTQNGELARQETRPIGIGCLCKSGDKPRPGNREGWPDSAPVDGRRVSKERFSSSLPNPVTVHSHRRTERRIRGPLGVLVTASGGLAESAPPPCKVGSRLDKTGRRWASRASQSPGVGSRSAEGWRGSVAVGEPGAWLDALQRLIVGHGVQKFMARHQASNPEMGRSQWLPRQACHP